MAIDLRFAFVCQKKWNDLVGTDPIYRFCPECSRDIVNLDPLTEATRKRFFRDAQRAGMTPCVFATVPIANVPSCKDTLVEEEDVEFPQLGGMPEMPDDDLIDFNDPDEDEEVNINRVFEDLK